MEETPARTARDALERLQRRLGSELGVSPWVEITQERIDAFTEATDDHQWIHIDPERAAKGPFGATIAQGYLTLSLTVPLAASIGLPLEIPPRMVVNYGLERVRFPAPIRVGSRIRARVELESVGEVPQGVQVVRLVTIEIEGGAKPGMVAETVSRLIW